MKVGYDASLPISGDYSKVYRLASLPKSAAAWRCLAIVPTTWAMGLLSLLLFAAVLPESWAFVSSSCGAFFAVVMVWMFFLKRIDPSISFPFIATVFFLKAIFIYFVWTRNVFAPMAGGDLEVSRFAYFDEAYHFWRQIDKIVAWWEDEGITIVFPYAYYINYDHPQAMALLSLPFAVLPKWSEVLIPWNMFYTTAAAAVIYNLGCIEGYSKHVCKAAFYLVLLQPFGWYVWEPLKRDTQCQMVFAFFLLAVVAFRNRALVLVAASVIGGVVLSLYRTIYGPILIFTAVYAYVMADARISGKVAKRILIVGLVLGTLFPIVSRYTDEPTKYAVQLVKKYGIGDAQVVATKGYQDRLTKHSSWIASVPERLALGLIVPFPWTNILKSRNAFEWSWKLTDYLHTALMSVCFATIAIFGWRDLKKGRCPPASVVFALGVAASGVFGVAVHNVYVQVGMLSSFPYVIDKLGKGGTAKWFSVNVLFFLFASIVWHFAR